MARALLCLLLLITMILLAACATDQALVSSVPVVEVPKPVVEKCLAPGDLRAPPPTHMVKGGDMESNANGVSADRRDLQLYADEVYLVVRSKCEEQVNPK